VALNQDIAFEDVSQPILTQSKNDDYDDKCYGIIPVLLFVQKFWHQVKVIEVKKTNIHYTEKAKYDCQLRSRHFAVAMGQEHEIRDNAYPKNNMPEYLPVTLHCI